MYCILEYYCTTEEYLSMDQTIVLSTDIQKWHDCNAFQLPNSTEQCELIDMSHYHVSCISRFLLLCGVQGQLVLRCPQVPYKPGKQD
jgi:hypothetical protein